MKRTRKEDDVARDEEFLQQAIELARANIAKGGRPFGAVVVKNGEVVASSVNQTFATNDPTDHAEMAALRAASQALNSSDLRGTTMYASGQPCPMCVAAMRIAGVERAVHAYSNDDGAPFGLSNAWLYGELANPAAELKMKLEHTNSAHDPDNGIYADWKRAQPQ